MLIFGFFHFQGKALLFGGCQLVEQRNVNQADERRREAAVIQAVAAVEQGHRATAFFVVQMAEVTDFAPNDDTHPAFGAALRQAAAAGVNVVAYACRVAPDRMEIDRPVPVIL